MKKIVFSALLLIIVTAKGFGQITRDISGNLYGSIEWSNDTIYILKGFVYVKPGANLIIEPGTVIRGDKETKGSLIITRGGKIFAYGTADQPIVFTSNQPEGSRSYGDWGGLIILGYAPINVPGDTAIIEGGVDTPEGDGVYGGENPHDISGALTYVRIEYPGIAFAPNNEINGLTLGGVGDITVIDHIMVSYSGDDSYEFFGGTVNAKYLIANKGLDDDFDTDNGYSGHLQYIVSLRDPAIADVSGSNGFESDNDALGSTNTPVTNPIISNATIIGPIHEAGDIINVNFKRGAHLRRNTTENIFNSVITGFPSGIMVDGAASEGNADANLLQVQNIVIAGNTNEFELAAGSVWDITSWFNTPAFENESYTSVDELNMSNPFDATNPDFRPLAASLLLSGASFSNPAITGSGGFFDEVAYRGAFNKDENWTLCWANWDPQNADYSSGLGTIAQATSYFTYDADSITYTVNFSQEASNAVSYFWTFGDPLVAPDDTSSLPNPSWTYSADGTYEVKLLVYGACGDVDSFTQTIDFTGLAVNTIDIIGQIRLYPNPANTTANIQMTVKETTPITLLLTDIAGRLCLSKELGSVAPGIRNEQLDISTLSAGIYFLNILTDSGKATTKLVVGK